MRVQVFIGATSRNADKDAGVISRVFAALIPKTRDVAVVDELPLPEGCWLAKTVDGIRTVGQYNVRNGTVLLRCDALLEVTSIEGLEAVIAAVQKKPMIEHVDVGDIGWHVVGDRTTSVELRMEPQPLRGM